ncbi:bacterial extracellular solute-binding family protein [Candidatus Phytoplasma oryzae]|uniref:Bacterial extracellular solute-binding family protein n=1 Tax=Candidatus Phytoplasma oryzae TaxID=203274 RepID=A0A139JQS7_9MOLU|nr:extracellular solute-binding protein [Candidatus Phytoplasma oryzae]KXT29298.1 bacterial extracellular solute-binding family protein [Candidatus Phytoplasma oryzae]RAM57571.1 hypothetical protein DH96_02385 [Candidatus Phytoplasma oryzae]
MVLKVNFKDIFLVIIIFFIILFLILIDNKIKPKTNQQKIVNDYLELEKTMKKNFYNDDLQKQYFKNKKVKIVFWHNLYPQEQILMDKIIKKFKEKFHIEILHFSKGNWGQIYKSISNSLPVNQQPHLSLSYPDHVQSYAKSRKIVPLSLFMANDEDFKNNSQDKFFPSFLSSVSLDENTNHKDFFFFPFLKTTEVMFYNSNILKEIQEKEIKDIELKKIIDDKINKEGIIQKPLFWEELQKIALAIKQKKTQDQSFIPIIIESESNFFIIDSEQNKNSLPSNKKEAEDFLRQNIIKERMMYFKEEFIDKNLLTTTKLSGEGNLQDFFKEQKSCFFISSTRRSSSLINNNFYPEITSFPTSCISDNNKNVFCERNYLLQGSNINLFYSSDQDEMLASWLFLKHLTSKETYTKIIQEGTGVIFSRKDVKEDFEKIKLQNQQHEKQIKQELEKFNNNLSDEEKLNKKKKIFYYKFINFILEFKDDIQNKDQTFFAPSFYEGSAFFRNILTELFINILALENNTKQYNLKKEVDLLFQEAIQRITIY